MEGKQAVLTTEMLFSNWASLARTVLVGSLAYLGLVLVLRISGNRTLSKMNSFDLIVTVALGSTLATVVLNKDVTLAEGLTAFVLLIGLQLVVTWLSVRTTYVSRLVRSEPRLLLYRGEFLDEAMCAARVTKSEVLQAVRSQGVLAVDDIEGIVLETNGTLSVVTRSDTANRSSLAGLEPNSSNPQKRS